MNTITIAGKEIIVADDEIREDVAEALVEENNEEEFEAVDGVTLSDLDEDDPIEGSAKALFEACLATGQIPLTATGLTLILQIEALQCKVKNGKEKWEMETDDNEVAAIRLTPNERKTAISGLASSWIETVKKLVLFQKKLGSQITESQAQELQTAQSENENAFSDFKMALRFLMKDEPETISPESAGAVAMSETLKEIRKLKNQWAFEQFMKLPKQYVSYAFFAENAKDTTKVEIPADDEEDS